MYEAVIEFLEPQLQIRDEKIKEEAKKEAFQEARKKAIQEMVDILKESGLGKADTIEFVMEKYGLSETESKSFFPPDSNKSNTPLLGAGYLTLAAFAKYPRKRGCLAHCSRE